MSRRVPGQRTSRRASRTDSGVGGLVAAKITPPYWDKDYPDSRYRE
jgi:hypothetical protein